MFERYATFPVFEHSPEDEQDNQTVAEITAVSQDGQTLVSTDAAQNRVTFTDISDPRNPKPATGQGGALPSSLALPGEPTSVAVHGEHLLIAVDTSADFTNPSGQLIVARFADRAVVRTIDLGGQPDSIAISPKNARGGTYAAIAIENQRDEDVNDGEMPQLPAGFLVRIQLSDAVEAWTPATGDITAALAGVSGVHAPSDPEPEYVSINARNEIALTLQENNAIAIIDARDGRVIKAFSAGTVDLNGIDTVEDGTIDLTGSLAGVRREPDAVGWIDDRYIATANEGDLVGGSRGWTVFDARTGAVIWDAGNSFERLAVQVGLYPENRSENKGTEPEGLTVAKFAGRTYAFVGSERGNFVAVYDVSNPRSPRAVQVLPTTNGPEGLLATPSRNLFVVSSEVDDPDEDVRSSITVFGLTRGKAQFPSIESDTVRGVPIAWGALSALTADPKRPNRLWSVSDSYYSPTQLFAIDAARVPAVITGAVTVTENGAPLGVDGEGLFARPEGGWWLASEGATGPENQILRLDAKAAVQQRISLPEDIAAGLRSNGLEGITATDRGASEKVFVALQRPLTGESFARIGRYDVTASTWSWFGYPLDAGSSVGLSEITALDDDSFAVIERDNRPGPFAEVKRIYRFDVPAGPATGVPLLEKTLVRDLLPDLQATNGWVQEKVEGLTIGGDRSVYVVTDNDGVEDATGETVFLNLGSRWQVFGR